MKRSDTRPHDDRPRRAPESSVRFAGVNSTTGDPRFDVPRYTAAEIVEDLEAARAELAQIAATLGDTAD
jgi:hypothetical protein